MKKYAVSAFLISAFLIASSCVTQPVSPEPKVENVENKTISITWNSWGSDGKEVETITREGTYSGQMMNGIPNGEGTFSSVNDNGVTWTYTGDFKDGTFNGQGKTTWEGSDELEDGTYVDGLFTPTTCELFVSTAPIFAIPYSISEKNQSFIEENQNIFPATTEEAQSKLSTFIRTDLTYPMMTKTLEGLEGQLYQCSRAVAVQVFQESMYGHTMTAIIASDEEYNYYVILYDGALPDVFDNTPICFTALPISSSGYENVSGGSTNVIVMIGSSVSVLE